MHVPLLCDTAHAKKMEKSKFSSMESEMVANDLYKSIQDQDKDHHQGTRDYIPATTTSQPQSGVYDSLGSSTPSHTVKQSDNPLYSSTQELRMSTTYDTIPSRGRSTTPSDVPPRVPDPNTIPLKATSEPNYAMPQFDKNLLATGSTGSKNRLSYGLELELSNLEIPPVHHQRNLSQGVDPVYTEL